MPEYLAPGVFVEEVPSPPSIEGVSTSTAGFVGMTRRGPSKGVPVLVTSFSDFKNKFGGYIVPPAGFDGHRYLPFAVDGFFSNGGRRLFIMRVIAGGANPATKANTTATGGFVTRLRDDTVPAATVFTPTSLRGFQVGRQVVLRRIRDGVTLDSTPRAVTEVDRATGQVTLNGALPNQIMEARFTIVLTDVNSLTAAGNVNALGAATDPKPNTFTIEAIDEGSWGKEIDVQAYHESAASSAMAAHVAAPAVDATRIRLQSVAGFYPNAWVEIDRGETKAYRRIISVDPVLREVTLAGPAITAANVAPQLPAPDDFTVFSTCEFRINVTFEDVTETFAGLTLENVPGRFFKSAIDNGSGLIRVGNPPGATHPFLYPSGQVLPATGMPSPAETLRIRLDAGGSDGANAPTDADYIGVAPTPDTRTGIKALEAIDSISIVAAPGITTQPVQNALINHCVAMKYRFAILDPNPKANNGAPDLNDIQNQRKLYDSKYAAIYYPRLKVYDPIADNQNHVVPPSGHVAGVFARVDIDRGVHKSPANEIIFNITGLEAKVTRGEQEILNPAPLNINVLRDFRDDARSFRIYGGRCITSESPWKYVNVRRLFNFVEKSLDLGFQFAVFEPNDEPLWNSVRQITTDFLTLVWRSGALQGATPEEAFYVKCDRTTMTQPEIDAGRLIVFIGIAPVKPAEFVIIRIQQKTAGAVEA